MACGLLWRLLPAALSPLEGASPRQRGGSAGAGLASSHERVLLEAEALAVEQEIEALVDARAELLGELARQLGCSVEQLPWVSAPWRGDRRAGGAERGAVSALGWR